MASKAERTATTRKALIGAAEQLFSERGFAATSTEEIVSRAGVTRGALYHHFADKTELFANVYEDIERRLVEDLVGKMVFTGDPVEVIGQAIDGFLDVLLDPAVRRIALVEGPTVIGWQRWREIQERYGLGVTKAALHGSMEAGALERLPVDALAHVLLGALVEAGMVMATSEDPELAKADFSTTLRTVVERLRP